MKLKSFIIILLILMIIVGLFPLNKSESNRQRYINNSIIRKGVTADDNIPKANIVSKDNVTKIDVIKDEIAHEEQFIVNKTSGEVKKLPWGNNTIGPYTKSRGYLEGPTYNGTHLITTIGGGVCKIASTLYNVAVKSNMQIVERHAHCMPVSYVPYGQDATVYYRSLDFKFKNSTNSPILIWSQAIDNALYISFYGNSIPPKVEWHHQVLNTKKTTKVYKINKTLPPGEINLTVNGMDGATLNSWVTVEYPDRIITKQLGQSRYLPLPYIYEKGS